MSVVGTRGSDLARTQTGWVIERLRAASPGHAWERLLITTSGDQGAGVPLGTGVFVKEIQQALLDRRIDVAVHSLKDLPTDPTPGLVVAAMPVREDPREALVGSTLAGLAPGATVGTGSPRRVAQLRRLRPDLDVVPVRGNLPTRIGKARSGELAAVMLAAAGLARLGIAPDDLIDAEVFLPAPGQGALAIETRDGDSEVRAIVATLDDPATRSAVVAERAVLRALGGGCLLPVATFGRIIGGTLVVDASVTSPDGREQILARAEGYPGDPLGVGAEAAGLLIARGALELLGMDHVGGNGAREA